MDKQALKLQTSKDAESSFLGDIIKEIDELKKEIDITNYLRWSSQVLGIGLTPLLEIPQEINHYSRDGVHIFYKPEFLNSGGSGKGRPVSFMLYYYLQKGILDNIETITTAGFGNFMRSLTEIIHQLNLPITTKAHMGQILLEENPDLINYLRGKGAIIEVCDDGYCPTGDMDRGKAISNAFIEDQTIPTMLMLDQHAVYKPIDGLLNAAGYFYSLVPEILFQTNRLENLYYVNGEGTRGSLVGTAIGLKKARPEVKVIGLRQQEDAHIFGLRSKKQLGNSKSLGRAEDLCDNVYEINDREAYSTMINLWKVGIPATPSGGSYVAGALKLAEELEGETANIVTMIFDSLEFYKNILELWIPRILGSKLDVKIFNNLQTKALSERVAHTSVLKQGESDLNNSIIDNHS
jgi:cysteine synthase